MATFKRTKSNFSIQPSDGSWTISTVVHPNSRREPEKNTPRELPSDTEQPEPEASSISAYEGMDAYQMLLNFAASPVKPIDLTEPED